MKLGIEKNTKFDDMWGTQCYTKEINQKKDPHPLLYAIWQNMRADAELPWIFTHIYAYYPNFAVKPPFHIYILIPMHKINLIQTYFSTE